MLPINQYKQELKVGDIISYAVSGGRGSGSLEMGVIKRINPASTGFSLTISHLSYNQKDLSSHSIRNYTNTLALDREYVLSLGYDNLVELSDKLKGDQV